MSSSGPDSAALSSADSAAAHSGQSFAQMEPGLSSGSGPDTNANSLHVHTNSDTSFDKSTNTNEAFSLVAAIACALEKSAQNKAALQRLLERSAQIVSVLSEAPRVHNSLTSHVTEFLADFHTVVQQTVQASFMHNFINKDALAAKVTDLNQRLSSISQELAIRMQIDTQKWLDEDREDRRMDAEELDRTLQHLVDNDYKILNALELKQVEYLEAIEALEKNIGDHFDRAFERNLDKVFVDRALASLRRATQSNANPTLPVRPAEWVLTSWEFELGLVISRGGFGEVLEATWLGHTRVAVKRLHIRLETAKLKDDFLREVKTWYPLRHPNILPLLGACASAERPFMVSPYMERGHALQYLEFTARTGPVEPFGIRLLYEVSLGMQYLHARNVCHGDLKAMNVLVDEYGKACVGDFGFASLKRYTTTKTSASSPQFGGTLRWMSPERLQGSKLVPPVDVYAYAMTCYEVLSGGEVPFTETPDALVYQHVVNSNIRPEMPDEDSYPVTGGRLFSLMGTCWSADPFARPTFSSVSVAMKSMMAAAGPAIMMSMGALLKNVPSITVSSDALSRLTLSNQRMEASSAHALQQPVIFGSSRHVTNSTASPIRSSEYSDGTITAMASSVNAPPHVHVDPPITYPPPPALLPRPERSQNTLASPSSSPSTLVASTGSISLAKWVDQTNRATLPANFQVLVINTRGPGKTDILLFRTTDPAHSDVTIESFKYNAKDGPEASCVSIDETSPGTLAVSVTYPDPPPDAPKRGILGSLWGASGPTPATKLCIVLPRALDTFCVIGEGVKTHLDYQGPRVRTVQVRCRKGEIRGRFEGYADLGLRVESGRVDAQCVPDAAGRGYVRQDISVGTGSVGAVVTGYRGRVACSFGMGQVWLNGVDVAESDGGTTNRAMTGSGKLDDVVGGVPDAGAFDVGVSLGSVTVSFVPLEWIPPYPVLD